MLQTIENSADYLRRNIAEVRYERRQLQNKPFGETIKAEDERLRRLQQSMEMELRNLEAAE